MTRLSSRAIGLGLFGLLCLPLVASEQLQQDLKRIFDSKEFEEKHFGPARWIDGGAAYTTLENSAGSSDVKEVVEYETRSGTRKVLVPASALAPPGNAKPLKIEDYEWSQDRKRLLLFTDSKKVWRTNTRGDYWVRDQASGDLRRLGRDAPPSTLMFAKVSPDGTRAAYVRANNIYVEDLSSHKIRQLTSDGSPTLVNGTSDWVYEEELRLRDGFRWSPNGRHIAYWQFDTTGVQNFTLLNNTDSLYPKTTLIPYPKAGTLNSAVRIGVIGAEGGATRWMEVPGDPRYNYLFRMDWAGNPEELAIGQLNRLQNRLTVYLANAKSGKAASIFEDRDDAWVDVPTFGGTRDATFEWLQGGKELLWMSERDGWRHLYAAPRAGGEAKLIATGNGDIIHLERVDRQAQLIYYLASPENAYAELSLPRRAGWERHRAPSYARRRTREP